MNYIIQLTNKKTGQIITKEVNDLNDGEKLYFKFSLDMREFEDGEYDLELTKSGQLIIVDTLYIGDYQPNSLQYKRGDNTYIEIVLDAKFQNKEVEITEIETVVKTDEDYDGFKEVIIDATPLYENAYEMGNKDGYETGIKIQKELLETLTVTENGTYIKEDGYNEVIVNVPDLNGDYDTGYEDGFVDGKETGVNQAGEIIAETAQVLNITENGSYLTQYSEPYIPTNITGVYPNGNNFYSYAKITGSVYDTGIKIDENTNVELWWNNTDVNLNISEGFVIGFQANDNSIIWKIFWQQAHSTYVAEINQNGIQFNLDNVGWHHFKMSFANGFWLDGEKIGDFTKNVTGSTENTLKINGGHIEFNNFNANSWFGMIKINDNIIIPTANGFLNTTTNELLTNIRVGEYNYIEDNEIYGEGNLIKTVNVNVIPKINVAKTGLKFANSTFTKIPQWADFSGITNMSDMFNSCGNLTEIPLLNTSNVISMERMFRYCGKLKAIPSLDTSSVTNMKEMFYNCSQLTTIPALYTSKVTDMNAIFSSCGNLVSLPALDLSGININGYQAADFAGYSTLGNLTDVGGFIGLRKSITTNGWNKCPNLSYQSCINIMNGLYDFVGNSITPSSNEGQLKVHQNFLNLVGDEISIATNKGWVLSA